MKKLLLLFMLSWMAFSVMAQVAINQDGSQPDPSAMLDVKSSELGFLPPRMYDAQRNGIPSPAEGLIIFNATTKTFNCYNGTGWFELSHSFQSSVVGTNNPGGGVAVNENGNSANGSAILDVNSPTRGLLIPATSEWDLNPVLGLVYFDVGLKSLRYYNGSSWKTVCSSFVSNVTGSGTLVSKGVAINSSGSASNPSAILDVSSTTKGLLIPRMTEAQIGQILPVLGLTVYNTTSNTIDYYNGTNWEMLAAESPAQPDPIIGNDAPCETSSTTYSVTNVSGVVYTWVIPADWTITAGQGTNEITVTVGNDDGNITVTPSNACGDGVGQSLAVTPLADPLASAINGPVAPCDNSTGNVYSVTDMAGVTFAWTVPAGWTITAGQNSHSITVTAGTGDGNISVTPSNTCGVGTAATLAVTTPTIPAQPSVIAGATAPCETTSQVYSVTNVAGVTYTWAVPTGWTITAGQGTNSMTVTVGTSDGNITVTPSNICGNGTARSLAVTSPAVPEMPGTIVGSSSPLQCDALAGLTYSISAVSGATSYTWAYSGGGTPVGTGTNITFSPTSSGTLSVKANNTCGSSNNRTTSITITIMEVVDVTNPATGDTWMDRNLGASQVATRSNDFSAYGDLYQWGRLSDGHQCRTSGTTSTNSTTDVPGHSNFILEPNSPKDWRTPQNDNLWQGVSGINNPCPSGYRLPTETELNNERLSWSPSGSAGALASPLKLPMGGFRYYMTGSLLNTGSAAYYWSSTLDGTMSRRLYFDNGGSIVYTDYRAYGFSVRCIKD